MRRERLEAENDLLSLVFAVMKVQAKAMEDRLKDTNEGCSSDGFEARFQRLKSNLNSTSTRCKMTVSIFIKER